MDRDVVLDETLPAVTRELFQSFHEDDIQYCHWKSNEHLREGLFGETDLDLLVGHDQSDRTRRLLLDSGFKRFSGHGHAKYPGVEHYIGFDEETGRLLHIHLHYRLIIGGKRLKEYRVPWSEKLLSNRVLDSDTGVYRSSVEWEFVLLCIRYALKIRKRDYLKVLLRKSYLSDDFHREYEWLAERVNSTRAVELFVELLGEDARGIIRSAIESPPTFRQLRRLAKIVSHELKPYRTYGRLESDLRGQCREGYLALHVLRQKYNFPRPTRRSIPAGGLLIVFIGMDGAGKSTINRRIREWLSWKIDVYPVYFGSGEGPASPVRYPLLAAWRIFDWIRRLGSISSDDSARLEDDGSDKQRPIHVRAFRTLWALSLSFERGQKLKRAWRARNRGIVAVGDRYPQNQIVGFNDGRLLADWDESDSKIARLLSRWESSTYNDAERNPPDLVVKLLVSPETAAKRKPEMSLTELKRRQNAVDTLEYLDSTVLEVDANAPLDDVERTVKRAIWEAI